MDQIKYEHDVSEEKHHSMPPLFEVNIKEEWKYTEIAETKADFQEDTEIAETKTEFQDDIEIVETKIEFQEVQENSDWDIKKDCSNFDHYSRAANDETPVTYFPDNSNAKSGSILHYLLKTKTLERKMDKILAKDICPDQLNSVSKGYIQSISNSNKNEEPTTSAQEESKEVNVHETYSNIINLKYLYYGEKLSKMYECAECHRMFSHMGNFRRHVSIVHKGLKSHQCVECQRMFSQAVHLKAHINSMHKGIKSYQCSMCQKKFSQAARLKAHINSLHKGIKSYECDNCLGKFSNKVKLQRHINGVHDKIRNECLQCKKMFSNIYSLRRHVKGIHKGIKSYECKECRKVCSGAATLKKHYYMSHGLI